jgi:hypothetical protein
MKSFCSPKPTPKNAPIGHSTLGLTSPSQYMRRITWLRMATSSRGAMVTQKRWTQPVPSWEKRVSVSPAFSRRESPFMCWRSQEPSCRARPSRGLASPESGEE